MSSTGMTTLEVKKINRRKVYHYIYSHMTVAKQDISRDLNMSLTTVTQNLKMLEDEGLIQKMGVYASTGGRKANMLGINPTARIAIGVNILKEMVHFAAVDLYGEILESRTLPLPLCPDLEYCQSLGTELNDFIFGLSYPKDIVLGTGIAVQGITTPDGSSISYGKIMNLTGMTLDMFSQFIPFPCRLEHDSKASAYMEIRNKPEMNDTVVLFLNRNLGGAVVVGGRLHEGLSMHSGSLEHLCMDVNGPVCYCGKKGCLETYCSADSLKKAADEELEIFFQRLRDGHEKECSIWQDYLKNLGFAIRNINMIFDSHILLTGYLAPKITPEDVIVLSDIVAQLSPFPLPEDFIQVSHYGQMAPAVGAALFYIDEFLGEI